MLLDILKFIKFEMKSVTSLQGFKDAACDYLIICSVNEIYTCWMAQLLATRRINIVCYPFDRFGLAKVANDAGPRV